jgi:MYXO-CTERM domain-containing protein
VDAEVVKATQDADRSSEVGLDTFVGAGSDAKAGSGDVTDARAAADTGVDTQAAWDAAIERQAASDAGIDTQAAPSGGQVDLPDSGATVPQGQRLAKSSGCSCSVAAPSPDASLLVFAVAGMLALLVRRSRSR